MPVLNMHLRLRRATKRRESGQATIELGLIVILLCIVALGATDVARLFGADETVTNAAHEGAKLAAMDCQKYSCDSGGDLSGLTSMVKNQIIQESGLDSSKLSTSVTVISPTTAAYTGEKATIQVSVQYRFRFFGPWALLPSVGQTTTMSATSAEVVR